MNRFSFKRSIKTFVCIFGIAALAFGYDDLDLNMSTDDLFGDDASSSASGGDGGDGTFTGPGSSSGNFDQANIDELFGTFAPEPEKEDPAVPARVLPPFEGNYKILVGRPIYAVYESEGKTQWISSTAELYSLYKVSSFPRTQVFTMDQVDGVMPNYRDYSRRFNRQHFIAVAKRLGATHVLYQEYQPHKSKKEARFSMELYWIDEGATVVKASQDIVFNAFERGLDICLEKIADAMDKGAKKTPAYSQTVFGKDGKLLENFGNILAAEGSFTRDRAVATYQSAEKLITRNKGNLGVQFAAALLAGRAGYYDKAVTHINSVIDKSGDHPALQLYLAEYLRGAERYSEAMRAAETASKSPALRTQASIEMAAIHQAQGDLDRARSEYNSVMQSGEADGRVFFRLALLSILSNNVSESESYLSQAAENGFSLDENEYIQLGVAYSKIDGYEDKAIELLKRGMGVRQNNEEAWLAIAEIYGRTGNKASQADTYVNLFKINMNAHSARLREAGMIYEELGMIDKAKDAYSLYLDRRFSNADVSMNLARIYFNERNCQRLPDVLRGYDTIPEAMDMLQECGVKARKVDASKTMQNKKLSTFMLTMRITSGVMAVGGIAGGIILDGMVKEDGDKYSSWKDRNPDPSAINYQEVNNLRKKIDDNTMMRNLMYGVAAIGVSGFAVTWFF